MHNMLITSESLQSIYSLYDKQIEVHRTSGMSSFLILMVKTSCMIHPDLKGVLEKLDVLALHRARMFQH